MVLTNSISPCLPLRLRKEKSLSSFNSRKVFSLSKQSIQIWLVCNENYVIPILCLLCNCSIHFLSVWKASVYKSHMKHSRGCFKLYLVRGRSINDFVYQANPLPALNTTLGGHEAKNSGNLVTPFENLPQIWWIMEQSGNLLLFHMKTSWLKNCFVVSASLSENIFSIELR